MEANENLGTAPIEFVLKLGRIMLLLFNFGEFTKMHHPLSPHLLRSFIEVFAALVNLIGFVILATVMIGIILCVILVLRNVEVPPFMRRSYSEFTHHFGRPHLTLSELYINLLALVELV